MPQKNKKRYEINTCSPWDLAPSDLAACIAVIKSGNAVDPHSAAAELPHAIVLALARQAEQIVGIGTIKRARPAYAARIAARSGAAFKTDTPELGYVAVDRHHQGQKLSHRLVAALISTHDSPLFATTDNEYMKRTLVKAGFVQRGQEWKGKRGRLSLWIKN